MSDVPDDPIRVLVVDDEPGLADLIATRLEREDDRIDPVTATDAEEGFERLDGVDCVVSDYDMPGLDGVAFLERVRENHPDLPFILYTGKGGEEVASEAIAAGLTDYLQKGDGTDDYVLLANRIVNAVGQSRAERRATHTQRRLGELAENTDDVLWMFSADWEETLFVNSAYEEVWGRSTDALWADATDFLDGILPADRDRVRDAMRRLSKGETVEVEYRVDGPGDDVRWVWAKGTPITDDAGRVVRVAGFARDVTERKRRERDLRRKTRAMEEAPIGVVVTDSRREDNPIVWTNERFLELTGYAESEVLGRNCRFLQGEDTDPERVARMRKAIDADDPVTVELRNYRKDGTEFWNRVSIAPVYDEDGTVTNYVGFQQDVTEVKRRERALAEERAFVEQSLDALDDVFYVFSPEGEILRWNERLGEVTGYTDAEIAEMRPPDFFPEDHRDRVAEAVAEVIETGSARIQADYLTADGERIPHEFTGQRLTAPDGSVLGFAGIARDITDRLAYERRLERQNERLEEFASIVSHDLRNPLNVAHGHLELARAACESGDVHDHLDPIADAHDRMTRLVDELLTLAKEGDIATDVRSVSLGGVAETCWGRIEAAEASLHVADDPTVRADENRLEQLLENLFRNAVDHGGPAVSVRVGALDDGFYVADDGPGIPESEREKVFESGYTTREDGIGVGLSVVRRVADAHGWDLRVTESRDGGTRFELTGVERGC